MAIHVQNTQLLSFPGPTCISMAYHLAVFQLNLLLGPFIMKSAMKQASPSMSLLRHSTDGSGSVDEPPGSVRSEFADFPC